MDHNNSLHREIVNSVAGMVHHGIMYLLDVVMHLEIRALILEQNQQQIFRQLQLLQKSHL